MTQDLCMSANGLILSLDNSRNSINRVSQKRNVACMRGIMTPANSFPKTEVLHVVSAYRVRVLTLATKLVRTSGEFTFFPNLNERSLMAVHAAGSI